MNDTHSMYALYGRSVYKPKRQCVLVFKLRSEIVNPCSNIEHDPGAASTVSVVM